MVKKGGGEAGELTEQEEHRQRARGAKAQPTRCDPERWPFETSYGDHFETPARAYRHIDAWVRQAAHAAKPQLSQADALAKATVYDPYFCAGAAAKNLKSVGCGTVVNVNRDFYADIEAGKCPKRCCVVTNPPFSSDHKERLLNFLLKEPGPFCLLMPSWVAARSYWRQFLWKLREGGGGSISDAEDAAIPADIERSMGVVYVYPTTDYGFHHVDGKQRQKSPFHSMWFLGGLQPDAAEAAAKEIASVGSDQKGVRVVRTLADLRSRELVGDAKEVKRRQRAERKAEKRQREEPKQKPAAAAPAGPPVNPFARRKPGDGSSAPPAKRPRRACVVKV